MDRYPKHKVRQNPRSDIIKNNTPSPFHVALQPPDGKRFRDVEETEGDESGNDIIPTKGKKGHRDKITRDLVDDDLLRVFFLKVSLGESCNPDGEEEKSKDKEKEIKRRKTL